MSIPPDSTHIPGAGVAAGVPSPDRETMPIPSDCEGVPGNGSDAGNPFFVRFYVDDGILVEVFLSRRAQVATYHRFPRVGSFSIARPPRSTGPPPLLEAYEFWGGVHVWRY